MKQPLAFRMRPETTKDLLGQSHLLGPGKVITKCLDAGRLFSMIFYGQPGTGKTTMAMCLAGQRGTKRVVPIVPSPSFPLTVKAGILQD